MNGEGKSRKKRESWKEKLRRRQLRLQRSLETHKSRLEKLRQKKIKRIFWKKLTLGACLAALIVGLCLAAYFTQNQPSQEPSSSPKEQEPIETFNPNPNVIYIWPDGHIQPESARINVSGNRYTFTGNLSLPIIVLKDNIVIDGANYTLKGLEEPGSRGIDLSYRKGVTIMNLKIQGFERGIYLASASNITITRNELKDNYCGIWLEHSSSNMINANLISGNQGYGIWLKNSTSNLISRNTLTSHMNYTIYMGYSNSNRIYQNNLTGNTICLFIYSSSNNTITRNFIAYNYQAINFMYSPENVVLENNILGNGIGLAFTYSNNNLVYHNNFINNTIHISIENSTNIWDNGLNYGGNYWSDYADKYPEARKLDDHEFWDTPYVIDENNVDRYPLIDKFKIA